MVYSFSSPKDHWTELNIGPFYVATDGDVNAARNVLAQLEQTRWVLAGLLDDQALTSTWPIRVILSAGSTERVGFVSQNPPNLSGQHVILLPVGARPPLGDLAGQLLDQSTPRLPTEIESGVRQLFDTLDVKGSHVSWASAPAHPDLAFARMQLFATKFEYSASFHIFLTSLKNGGTLRTSEANAFGQPYEALEREAAARLGSNRTEPTSVTGRPLDPKRDFGEHVLDSQTAGLLRAIALAPQHPKESEATFQSARQTALAAEGLAQIAVQAREDPAEFLDTAMHAGSRSAPVYLAASEGRNSAEALRLAKRAEALNPHWAAPLVRQAELTTSVAEREDLLKRAVLLDRRQPPYWVALAKVQVENGHAPAAASSWIRAEDAADSPASRDEIHRQRLVAEASRLDASEAAREEQENAAYRADQRAQRAQAARVQAAERKANQSNAAEASKGGAGQADEKDAPVAWNQLAPQKKTDGSLLQVDCVGSNARLTFQDRAGATLHLFWRNTSELGLSCGPQQPPLRVSVTYTAQIDEATRTDGAVLTLQVWKAHRP